MAGTAAVAASLSLCGVATSQQADGTAAAGSNTYLNDQVQLGDVIAGQTLNVQQASTGASAVTTSVANAVSAGATNADLRLPVQPGGERLGGGQHQRAGERRRARST